jgi:hypothetical protein
MSGEPSRISRLAGEFAIIVCGVLVALGLEATWQARQDRVRESEIIQDLIEEFQANRVRLLSDIEVNRASLAAAEGLERMPSSSSLPFDLDEGFGIRRYDPLDGVLQSTLETGELSLIVDPSLRAALAGWSARVREAEQSALTAISGRGEILPDLFDVMLGETTYERRRLVVGWSRGFMTIPLRQQEELLVEMDRILTLLEGAGGNPGQSF